MQLNSNIALSRSGFVFNPQSGESFSLNPVAVEILELMKQGLTQEQIVDILTQEYEISSSSFLCDLEDFICLLNQYGMLENER